jgi:transposase
MHVRNIRKWIHRFNEKGIEGILTKKKPGRKPRINGACVQLFINPSYNDL